MLGGGVIVFLGGGGDDCILCCIIEGVVDCMLAYIPYPGVESTVFINDLIG